MKSKLFVFLLCVISIFRIEAAASSEQQQVKDFVEEQGNNLLSAFAEKDLYEKYRLLDNLFLEYVDIEYLGRFVVGKYWRNMTEEQQQQYQDLFQRYIINLYKGFPLQFENRISFGIGDVHYKDADVFVETNIIYKKNSEEISVLVEFRLHKYSGKYKIRDIKIAESSLLLSYRNKFYEKIKAADEEMEWFLDDFALDTVAVEKAYALPQN